MASAERLIRPVPLTLGGKSWSVLITYGVLLDCEETTGADLFGNLASLSNPSARVLRGLLWAALKRSGAKLTPRDVGEMVNHRNLPEIRQQLSAAFVASMPDPEPARKGSVVSMSSAPPTRLEVWAAATSKHGLGLSHAEWEEMTPRQFHALRQVHVAAMQREELMFSRLTSKFINFSQRGPEKPLPEDYYMLHKLPQPEEYDGPLTGERIMAEMAIFRKGKL